MGLLPWKKTNVKTVEDLLLTNYNQYFRLAYSYVHNDDDAGDIVQNAACKAIKNSSQLKEQQYAATWLYRIVINEIFTFCSQKKTEPLEYTEEPLSEDSYEDIDLKLALESLPLEEKIIVELKYFEDMKLEEDPKADSKAKETVQKTAEEINAEIESISKQLIEEFEENAKDQEGYQDMLVTSEVIAATEKYFTLKLICYQGAGSGAEWDYFYTIDLETGKRLALKDLFQKDSDYITAISENIIEQMKDQMASDENLIYWVDSDIPDLNFKTITDETGFYLNDKEELVICFNEGDVAPMYMGCVEFVIPKEALGSIWVK